MQSGGNLGECVRAQQTSANEWAPVHSSSAGPYIFVIGEGFLVDTSAFFKIEKRVAFALRSCG